MSEYFDILRLHLAKLVKFSERDLTDAQPFWKRRKVKKGDFHNMQSMVYNDLSLVVSGIFRIYYVDETTGEQKNLFFFSENQFLVSFRCFLDQKFCHYFIQAMEDSEIIYISYRDLNSLYETNQNWTKFGKLIAELFFNYSQSRAEELLFKTHEQRYINLLNEHSNIVNRVPAYHISSYLGITSPSLSRIRKRINRKWASQEEICHHGGLG